METPMLIQPAGQTGAGLRSFVTACLERAGAVLEEAGYELVEALLPEELSNLQDREHLLLAFDYETARENPEAIFLTYGSPLLDRLAGLAVGYGRYTVLYGPEAGLKPAAWLEREISEVIEFVRCRMPRVVEQRLAEHVFRGFYFRAGFRAHEKTEELLEVVVNGSTGLAVPDFAGWWANVVAAEEPGWKLPAAPNLPLAELYQAACREAERQAIERALTLQEEARGRREREMTRVSGYYARLIREIENKLAATEDETRKERLTKQLAAVEADRQRREKDVLDRYAVEAELCLDHLIDYHLPLLNVGLEVQHKKQVLSTTVFFNPFARRVETPVCPFCCRPSSRLIPDGAGRLVCPAHAS